VRQQRRAVECARAGLTQDDLAGDRRKLGNDVVAPAALLRRARATTSAAVRGFAPAQHARVLETSDVHDRQAQLARHAEQVLQMRQRRPGRHAAAARPGLDGLEERARLVPEHPAVQVDQHQRWLLAKPNATVA